MVAVWFRFRVPFEFKYRCFSGLVVLFPLLYCCAPRVRGCWLLVSCFGAGFGGRAGKICLHWSSANINIAMIYTYYHPVSLSFGTYTTLATLAGSHGLNAGSLRTSFSRCRGDLITLRCGAVVFRSTIIKSKALRREGFNT